MQDVEVDVDEETSTDNVPEQESITVKGSSRVIQSANRKSKKKKKKSKEDPGSNKNKIEKSIDQIFDSLSIVTNDQTGSEKMKSVSTRVPANLVKQCTSSVLAVDPKFLKAENELRRIFGSKVVSSFENNHNSSSSRQMHGGRRGGHNPRKTILVAPSSFWPRWDGSLSMETLETKDGQHFFR